MGQIRKEEFKDMASKTKTSKSRDAANAALMIAGIAKHYASISTVMVDGASYTPAQLTASLQTLVDLRSAVDAARAAFEAKVENERSQLPALRKLVNALSTVVRGTFGNSPDVLTDFGITPRKAATPLTIEQKAAAAAKRSSTRQARHTMGTKQRQAIKGSVTGIVITPATAPQPVAPAPATSAPNPGTPAATPTHGT
jgi:hypothetical protein